MSQKLCSSASFATQNQFSYSAAAQISRSYRVKTDLKVKFKLCTQITILFYVGLCLLNGGKTKRCPSQQGMILIPNIQLSTLVGMAYSSGSFQQYQKDNFSTYGPEACGSSR